MKIFGSDSPVEFMVLQCHQIVFGIRSLQTAFMLSNNVNRVTLHLGIVFHTLNVSFLNITFYKYGYIIINVEFRITSTAIENFQIWQDQVSEPMD